MYGQRGEGRIQQLSYVIEKTDAAIAELEAKRAQIDTALAELRFINARSRQTWSTSSTKTAVRPDGGPRRLGCRWGPRCAQCVTANIAASGVARPGFAQR